MTDSGFRNFERRNAAHSGKIGRRKVKKPERGKEIDIKFGAGGMLDVYFAVQVFTIARQCAGQRGKSLDTFLHSKNFTKMIHLSAEDYQNFSKGYEFLTELDHNLRLTIGRSTRLPSANQTALQTIVKRMNFSSISKLLETLTLHRLNISRLI